MPLVNVIRGEPVPDALLNVRTPLLRVPLWLLITWWCLQRLVLAAVLACRHWYLTAPLVLLAWLWWRFGWPGPAAAAGGTVVVAATWWLVDAGRRGASTPATTAACSGRRWGAVQH
jgi:hypothetical protein